MEILQSKEQKEERMKNNNQILRDQQAIIQHTDVHIEVVLEGQEKKKKTGDKNNTWGNNSPRFLAGGNTLIFTFEKHNECKVR